MPRPLDLFVPCRKMDTATPLDPERPWRTADGGLVCSEPAAPRMRKRRARRPPRRGRALGAAALLGIVAAVSAALAFPAVRATAAAAMPTASPRRVFGQNHVRLLILGADQDYGPQGERIAGGRSDTLILADLDLVRNQARLCSIPRDTEADIPGHGTRRINAAYAIGGADMARETVENLTGLAVDHTVTVNLEAFREAVDALGGVEVTVDKPLRYQDRWAGLNIDIPAGRQRLDGERAMQFVRFRHDALADIGRARRQQEFLHAVGDALRRPAAVAALPGVVGAVSRHTETDLDAAHMVALGRFARGLDEGALSTETLPGTFHRSRWRPDRAAVRRMAARFSQ